MKKNVVILLDCGHEKPSNADFENSYLTDKAGKTSCFACYAKIDKANMRKDGKATLYLVLHDGKYFVENWTGAISFPVQRYRPSRHNMAGTRTDVWFRFDGATWHGYQIGENTHVCHCRRTKTGG